MKTMKKLASVALALCLAMSLAVPAFAANEQGSITVTNAEPGQDYTVYKLFDLAYGGTADGEENAPHTYSIDSESPWYAFVTGEGEGTAYVTVDEQNYVTWNGTADAAAFAKLALAYAKKNEIGNQGTATAGEATNEDGTTAVTFSGLDLGYYLIDSSLGALCSLDSTNRNANVTEKNEKPTVEKEAVELPDGIGDTIPYQVTVHAKKGAEKYVVHDTMSTGLSFNNDVVVTVGEDTVDAKNYTVNTETEDDCTFEVVFEQAYLDTLTAETTDIVVTYSATVTADALVIDKVTNTAKLTYGDKAEPKETLPSDVEIPLYQFDLVKTNSDEMGKEVLSGAEFQLYNVETDGTPISLVFVEEGNYYRPATEEDETTTTTIEAGFVTIKGLGAGTYYLEETKQPEGYNLLKGRTSVTVGKDIDLTATVTPAQTEGEGDEAVTTPATYVEGGVRIVNLTGAELPSTGGIGTTLFYIGGGILVVGAGILLITKKRMGAEEE